MILEINNLTKKYKGNVILNNVSIQIDNGKIIGLIGENGAGKTTLMKIILQLVRADSGNVYLFNQRKFKQDFYKEIGALIEVPIFYENLTGEENLQLHLKYMKVSEHLSIDEVLSMVGLHDMNIQNKKVKSYSLGMKQRLGIARALIHKPSFVILDEPVNGLSPTGVIEMRNLFSKLRKEGITFLISSHLLSELEVLADDTYILQNGMLEKLQNKNKDDNRWVISTSNSDLLLKQLITNFDLLPQQYKQLDGKIIINDMTSEIRKFLISNEKLVDGFGNYAETLEEKFIHSQTSDKSSEGEL